LAADLYVKLGKREGISRHQTTKRRHQQRQLHQACEIYEPRLVLSNITLVDGTLGIIIENDEQDLAVYGADDSLIVEIDGNAVQTFPIDQVTDLSITGNELDNEINLQGIPLGAIVGSVIYGNGGDDFVVGSMSPDLIVAGPGDDLAAGGGQSDTIDGNAGNDTLLGSSHGDEIDGGDGDDTLIGQAGDDSPNGGGGDDTIFDDCNAATDDCGAASPHPPTITNPGDQTSIEGDGTISLQIAATDPDLPADALSYQATGLPSGLTINPQTGLISGTIKLDAFEQGPAYNVTVTVSDSTPALPLTANTTFKSGPASLIATEYTNPTAPLPNRITVTAVSPVKQLFIEEGNFLGLKVNGVVLPPGLAPKDVIYRIGNSTVPPGAPTGNFGPTAAATPVIKPVFTTPVRMLLVQVGLDLNLDGVLTANEETQKFEVRPLSFDAANLTIKAQRVLPTVIKEELFPVKADEMFETGSLVMDKTVAPPVALRSWFRFELTGPEMGPSNVIRWEIRNESTSPATLNKEGAGSAFLVAFNSPRPKVTVRFYIDRNLSGTRDGNESSKLSPIFQVVNPVTHSLTFEYSLTITADTRLAFGTPAQRLAHAQGLADREDDILHIKEREDDWRVPVTFSLGPSAAATPGVFAPSPTRPDQVPQYNAQLHWDAPHDITFLANDPWYSAGLVKGWVEADGVTGSTGVVLNFTAPSLTFVHELGHFYGRPKHTPQTLAYDGYLMHPGPPEAVGGYTGAPLVDIGGILEKADATRFFKGVTV
jgi:hypothetical protein